VFTELRSVGDMLARARTGLRFSAATAQRARPLIEALFAREPAERVLGLIEVLALLSADAGAETLASPVAAQTSHGADRTRIDRVLDHIHAHYTEGVGIAELADIAALSPSGLHRLFRRHTHLAITEYLAQLRIGEACAMLSSGSKPVRFIASEVGYDSLGNFNRQFKALKGLTPREYRARFRFGR
jgi:AraC-like DNA-binding protein